jgi:acetyl esterase/lipase
LSYLKRQAMSLQAQGFSVFSINYRQDTASKPAFPLEPDDVIMATQWAIAHAAAYDANPANVVLVGGSAGGNLAELAAEQLDAAQPGTIKAVVSLSGPTDFETLIPLVEDGTIHNRNFITSIYRAIGGDEEEGFFGGEGDEGEEVALTQALMREGSPAMHIPSKANCPDWLLFSSEEDLVPLPQAQEMYGDLLGAGCKATLQVVPGSQHAFAYWNHVDDAVFSFVAGE